MMNSKKLVPIYYSRAFVRYFKTKLYAEVLEKNTKSLQKVLGEDYPTQTVETYTSNLEEHVDFQNNKDVEKLHNAYVAAFKAMKLTMKAKPSYEIPVAILTKKFEDLFKKEATTSANDNKK